MNNTHYVLMSEDGNPIAIVEKNYSENALYTALKEEYCGQEIKIKPVKKEKSTDIKTLKITVGGYTEKITLHPTWLYK